MHGTIRLWARTRGADARHHEAAVSSARQQHGDGRARGLAEVAQPPNAGREQRVIGADRTGVAERAEVIARIEREGRGVAERARPAPAIRGAGRLRRILQ